MMDLIWPFMPWMEEKLNLKLGKVSPKPSQEFFYAVPKPIFSPIC